jgi:hypothetical protein
LTAKERGPSFGNFPANPFFKEFSGSFPGYSFGALEKKRIPGFVWVKNWWAKLSPFN